MGTALHCTLVTARYAKRSTSLTEEAVVLYLRMGRMRWLWHTACNVSECRHRELVLLKGPRCWLNKCALWGAVERVGEFTSRLISCIVTQGPPLDDSCGRLVYHLFDIC